MTDTAYKARRGQLETYFGRTAADKWVALTSNTPVSMIRATVRAGRDDMRGTLLNWLPDDLSGARLLDAGCGTGMLAMEAAKRGANVVAIDLSEALVEVARERTPADLNGGSIEYRSGDMTETALGDFDYVVAMDSFIHYSTPNLVGILEGFAARTRKSLLYTFAPKTPMLSMMHMAGQVFPRDNRSPAIVPVSEKRISSEIRQSGALQGFDIHRTHRVSTAFYKSQAMELAAK